MPTKLSLLPETTTPQDSDYLVLVQNTNTTPVARRIRKSNIITGGGVAESPLNGVHKTGIINSADNDLFSFPLAVGEVMGFTMHFTAVAKKGADWSIQSGIWCLSLYNDGGTLRIGYAQPNHPIDAGGGSLLLAGTKSAGSSIDIDNFDEVLNATLSTGIVTLKYNPGNIGDTPDSFDLDFAIVNPTSKVITFL